MFFKKKKVDTYNISLAKPELISVLAIGLKYYYRLVHIEDKDYIMFDCFESLHSINEDSDERFDVYLKVPLVHQYSLRGDKVFTSEIKDESWESIPEAILDFDNASLMIKQSNGFFYVLYQQVKYLETKELPKNHDFQDEIQFSPEFVSYLRKNYMGKDEESFNEFIQRVETRKHVEKKHQWIEEYRKKSTSWFKK